jgi:hypothetical protein
MYSPFSLGYIQNLVDVISRSIVCYTPIDIDWTRIYSIEDFNQSIPLRIRQKLNLSSVNSSIELLNVWIKCDMHEATFLFLHFVCNDIHYEKKTIECALRMKCFAFLLNKRLLC